MPDDERIYFEFGALQNSSLKANGPIFFVLSRQSRDGSVSIPLFRSNEERINNDQDFTFHPFHLKRNSIAAIDSERNISIEFFRAGWNGRHKILATASLSAREFCALKEDDTIVVASTHNMCLGSLNVLLATSISPSQHIYSFWMSEMRQNDHHVGQKLKERILPRRSIQRKSSWQKNFSRYHTGTKK